MDTVEAWTPVHLGGEVCCSPWVSHIVFNFNTSDVACQQRMHEWLLCALVCLSSTSNILIEIHGRVRQCAIHSKAVCSLRFPSFLWLWCSRVSVRIRTSSCCLSVLGIITRKSRFFFSKSSWGVSVVVHYKNCPIVAAVILYHDFRPPTPVVRNTVLVLGCLLIFCFPALLSWVS